MFLICKGQWIIKEMKPELCPESKEVVPCKVNWKHEIIIDNNGCPPSMVGSTQNTSENLQNYYITCGKFLLNSL